MIPMLQIVPNRLGSPPGDTLASSRADDPAFTLQDDAALSEQDDGAGGQDDSFTPAMLGMPTPALAAPRLQGAKMSFSEAVAESPGSDQALSSGVLGLAEIAVAEPGQSENPRLRPEAFPQDPAVGPTNLAAAAEQTGPLTPGVAENALRLRWAHPATGMGKTADQPALAPELALQVVPVGKSPLPLVSAPVLELVPGQVDGPDFTLRVEPAGEAFALPLVLSPMQTGAWSASGPVASVPTLGIAQLPARLVTHAMTGKDSHADLLLNPEELGRLRFSLRHDGDKLMVVLTAERPDTLALLRQNTPQLLAEFTAAGFSGASLSFGKWDGGDDRAAPLPDPAESTMMQPDAAPPPSRKSPVQGLDLRL